MVQPLLRFTSTEITVKTVYNNSWAIQLATCWQTTWTAEPHSLLSADKQLEWLSLTACYSLTNSLNRWALQLGYSLTHSLNRNKFQQNKETKNKLLKTSLRKLLISTSNFREQVSSPHLLQNLPSGFLLLLFSILYFSEYLLCEE